MWDDSYDSIPSIDDKKPSKGKNTSSYDFPDTKKSGRSSKKNSANDIDMLFSASNSASENNSPVGKEERRTYSSYNILDAPKPQEDYLANIAATSGDFEDSILGELLGGPSKKPPKLEPKQSSLDPILPTKPLNPPSSRTGASGQSGVGGAGGKTTSSSTSSRAAFRFATELSPPPSEPSSPEKRPYSPLDLPPPSNKPHSNSFDLSPSPTPTTPELAPPHPATSLDNLKTATRNTTLSRGPSLLGSSSTGIVGGGGMAEDNKEEVDLGGFVPSSMEAGGRGRRRRGGGLGASSGAGFDALDAALGLGIPAAPPGGSSHPINTTPAIATRKSITDPFARIESKLGGGGVGKAAAVVMGDSSDSDDDLLKPIKRGGGVGVGASITSKSMTASSKPSLASSLADLPAISPSSKAKSAVKEEGMFSEGAKEDAPLPPPPAPVPTSTFVSTSSNLVGETPPAPPLTPTAPSPSSEGGVRLSSVRLGGKSPSKSSPLKTSANTNAATSSLNDSQGAEPLPHIPRLRDTFNMPAPSLAVTERDKDRERDRDSKDRERGRDLTTTPVDSRLSVGEGAPPSLGLVGRTSGTLQRSGAAPSVSFSDVERVDKIVKESRAEMKERYATLSQDVAALSKSNSQEAIASTSAASSSLPAIHASQTTSSAASHPSSSLPTLYPPSSSMPSSLAAGTPDTITITLQEYSQLLHAREQNVRYLHDQVQYQQSISSLEHEVNKLRDDLYVNKERAAQELTHLRQTHQQELATLEGRQQQERSEAERRHRDAMSSMERVFKEELQVYKQKLQGVDTIDRISQQIYATTDSMKALEQELTTRHKYIEAVREGQFESREKLLADMEKQFAQQRDASEAEVYRLQGVVQHMESMVASLKNQHYEEKERLKAEYLRVLSLSEGLEREKKSFTALWQEEQKLSQQKLKDIQDTQSAWQVEKRMELEQLFNQKRVLEAQQRDFDLWCAGQKRQFEQQAKLLREEENRLGKIRQDIQVERERWEEKKLHVRFEVEASEKILNEIAEKTEQLARYDERLQTEKYHLSQREEEIQRLKASYLEQLQGLGEREEALREGFGEMKLAAQTLHERERGLENMQKILQERENELSERERILQEKKLGIARGYREMVMKGEGAQWGGGEEGALVQKENLPPSHMSVFTHPPSSAYSSSSAHAAPTYTNANKPAPALSSSVPTTSSTAHLTYRPSPLLATLQAQQRAQQSGLDRELRLAQLALKEHRLITQGGVPKKDTGLDSTSSSSGYSFMS